MSPAAAAPTRIAVVGTGAIAQVSHLPILTRMRGVQVSALYDSDRAKARTIADRFDVARIHRSLDDLWQDDEVDGVIVCTPSHLHEEQVQAGLEAGKYVLCEKPLALSAEGAQRLLDADAGRGRLMVGMNQRFRPDAAALRSFVASGELGEIFYLRSGWLNRRAGRGRRTWRQRKEGAGGGALMDLGIQMLDLSMWLLGYPVPERVFAMTHRAGGEVEDSAVLVVQLEGNRALNLEVTWALASERERQYVHVLGTSGSGTLGPLKVYREMDTGLADVTPPIAPGKENQFTASYRQQLAHFVDVLRGQAELEPPTEHVTLLRIMEAAYRAAEQGSEVRLR